MKLNGERWLYYTVGQWPERGLCNGRVYELCCRIHVLLNSLTALYAGHTVYVRQIEAWLSHEALCQLKSCQLLHKCMK